MLWEWVPNVCLISACLSNKMIYVYKNQLGSISMAFLKIKVVMLVVVVRTESNEYTSDSLIISEYYSKNYRLTYKARRLTKILR
jgi:hypothetical protein